jgi:hypothetical protein
VPISAKRSLDAATRFPARRTFTVASERFALAPTAVRSVFPADGSLGDHTNVLPHVVLDQPTRPGERTAGPSLPPTAGWLVLLVFPEDERPEPAAVTLGTLATGPAYIPAPEPGTHENAADPVTVIDVPRALLTSIMPSAEDLGLLAHVRSGDDETAVVIANRLPAPGVTCTVHLVSVEGRYGPSGFDLGPDLPGALVRLVTLATSMARWKRLRAMRLGREEPADHPLQVVEIDDTIPDDVAGYLAALARLEGVPFRQPRPGRAAAARRDDPFPGRGHRGPDDRDRRTRHVSARLLTS